MQINREKADAVVDDFDYLSDGFGSIFLPFPLAGAASDMMEGKESYRLARTGITHQVSGGRGSRFSQTRSSAGATAC